MLVFTRKTVNLLDLANSAEKLRNGVVSGTHTKCQGGPLTPRGHSAHFQL